MVSCGDPLKIDLSEDPVPILPPLARYDSLVDPSSVLSRTDAHFLECFVENKKIKGLEPTTKKSRCRVFEYNHEEFPHFVCLFLFGIFCLCAEGILIPSTYS
jgi:hypothetical protein